MNKMQEHFLRTSLKPVVGSDLPGRLRIGFARYNLLPEEARPYLHYIYDVLEMLPGVSEVRVNARIGTVLIIYDTGCCDAQRVLHWVDTVIDTGIELAKERDWQPSDEKLLEKIMRERLTRRLPG